MREKYSVDHGRISIQLTVSNLGITEAFYGGILELPVKRSFAVGRALEHLSISQNGFDLVFVPEEAVFSMQPELKQGMVECPKGIGMALRIRVSEIEDISDALEEEGIEVLYPLKAVPYGMKELWCFDPDGYLLALEEPWR
jgi:predicted enzyme related to lactoylglutathione lyase